MMLIATIDRNPLLIGGSYLDMQVRDKGILEKNQIGVLYSILI
jgi:hypothetical protein